MRQGERRRRIARHVLRRGPWAQPRGRRRCRSCSSRKPCVARLVRAGRMRRWRTVVDLRRPVPADGRRASIRRFAAPEPDREGNPDHDDERRPASRHRASHRPPRPPRLARPRRPPRTRGRSTASPRDRPSCPERAPHPGDRDEHRRGRHEVEDQTGPAGTGRTTRRHRRSPPRGSRPEQSGSEVPSRRAAVIGSPLIGGPSVLRRSGSRARRAGNDRTTTRRRSARG